MPLICLFFLHPPPTPFSLSPSLCLSIFPSLLSLSFPMFPLIRLSFPMFPDQSVIPNVPRSVCHSQCSQIRLSFSLYADQTVIPNVPRSECHSQCSQI